MFLRGFVCEDFSGGFFVRNSLEGILCLRRQSYLNMEGIYLFVKILVFVKILSQWRRRRRRARICERHLNFQKIELHGIVISVDYKILHKKEKFNFCLENLKKRFKK